MKTYKKILFGLSIAVVSLAITLAPLLVIKPDSAVADHQGPPRQFINSAGTLFNNNLVYTLNGNTITVTINNAFQNGDSVTLTFVDSTPNNTTYEYLTTQHYFCEDQVTFDVGKPAKITFASNPNQQTQTGQLTVYVLTLNASACGEISNRNIAVRNPNPGPNPQPVNTITYNGQTYTQIDPAYPLYALKTSKAPDCYGGSVILRQSATSAIVYSDLVYDASPNFTLTSLVSVLPNNASNALVQLAQNCYFSATANTAGTAITINASGQATCSNPNDPTCTPNTTGQPSCLDANTFSLGWLWCKIFDSIDWFVSHVYAAFEAQLCFKAGESSTDSGVNCDAQTNFLETQDPDKNGVYKAWSTFRIIATSLLVIAMLTMVIATAVRG